MLRELADDEYGSIPARAGGTARRAAMPAMPVGLSPRVRGNHRHDPTGVGADGSIPARAGEPHNRVVMLLRSPVYPRACGGTAVHKS